MACYTANLASGENLLCKTIKSGTITRYLSAAAELSLHANTMSPLLDITGKRSKYIADVINEIKRWEVMPNRREPLTKPIIKYIIQKGKSLASKSADNIYLALSDWLILGLQSGFRRKEWAQDKNHLTKYKDFFAENSSICEHEYPFLLNWTDNKTAKAWLRKAATKTEKGKSLQRILCSIMINNPMGVKSDYIKGEKNVIADFISRIFSSQNTAVTFDNLFVKFPQIEYWKRFHPSQELLSHLCSALLTGQDLGILEIKNLGHFSPGKSTS